MYLWYAKVTYGGYLTTGGGTSPGATIIFAPSIKKSVGKIGDKGVMGKISTNKMSGQINNNNKVGNIR